MNDEHREHWFPLLIVYPEVQTVHTEALLQDVQLLMNWLQATHVLLLARTYWLFTQEVQTEDEVHMLQLARLLVQRVQVFPEVK